MWPPWFLSHRPPQKKIAGVVYMSRVPPHMVREKEREWMGKGTRFFTRRPSQPFTPPSSQRPQKVRHILSAHAEIGRIYLAPEDGATRAARRKGAKAGGGASGGASSAASKRAKRYVEGWIEFEDKKVAKQVSERWFGVGREGKEKPAAVFFTQPTPIPTGRCHPQRHPHRWPPPLRPCSRPVDPQIPAWVSMGRPNSRCCRRLPRTRRAPRGGSFRGSRRARLLSGQSGCRAGGGAGGRAAGGQAGGRRRRGRRRGTTSPPRQAAVWPAPGCSGGG